MAELKEAVFMAQSEFIVERSKMLDVLGSYIDWLGVVEGKFGVTKDDVARLVCRFEKLVNSQAY